MSGLREGIERLLGRESTSAWSGSVADLLYEGEDVETTIEVGDNSVVVTSHRLLALTPDADGANFRAVDRPNVSAVGAGGNGDDDLLYRGLRTSLYAVLLVGIGYFFEFGNFIPSGVSARGAGRLGVGGLFSTMNRFLGLIGRIDELMVTFGALAGFLAVVLFGVYLLTRNTGITITVAGDDDDIFVPTEEDPSGAVERLDAVLFGDVDADAGTTTDARRGTDGDEFKSGDPL